MSMFLTIFGGSLCCLLLVSVSVLFCADNMSRVMRKPVLAVSDQIRHKPGCITEGGLWLGIEDLGSSGICVAKTKGSDKLRGYREAHLRTCLVYAE